MNTAKCRFPGIISVDLDGTVLSADHATISSRTRQVLEEYIHLGSQLVPNTGRCQDIIPLQEFPPVRYVISGNGSMIYDLKENRPLRAKYLPREHVRRVWEMIRQRVDIYHIPLELFEDNRIVVEQRVYDDFETYRNVLPRFHIGYIYEGKAKFVESFDKYLEEEGDRIIKINLPGKSIAGCPEIRQELIDLGLFEVTSDGTNLEATTKGCEKGEALLWLNNYLNLPESTLVSFGDGNNDLGMLRIAAYGVAMGNAAQSVKSEASYCTLPNTEDGIADFLERTFPLEL